MKVRLLALLLTAVAAFAQPRLTASVDRNPVRAGEALSLVVTFDGASAGVPSPSLPALSRLQITGGPFTSTNFSMVNGRTSSSIIYTYRLRASAEGTGEIGALSLSYQGKTYQTNPIAVKILAAGAPPPGGAQGGDAQGFADNVFIRAIPDKTSIVQGEQVTVSYKIYFNVQMTSPEITQLPRASGFWVEEIPMPSQLTLTDEIINGKTYKAAVIRKFAMFATGSGDLEVEPMIVTTQVERARNRGRGDPFDIFNDPFFRLGAAREEVSVQSPAVKLKVSPLPPDAPPGFNGAVGAWKISSSVDRPTARTNDAVTLTVRIEGVGNVKTLPEPAINFPPDFDRYDPKQSENISRTGGRIGGVKTFEYVLIPRAPGPQRIPEIPFAYFDPGSGRYLTVTAPALALLVERGEGGSGTMPPSVQRRDVTSVGTDIAFIKTKPGAFHGRGSWPHREVTFWLLTGGPWIALGALHLLATRRAAAADAMPSRIRQSKLANRHLMAAQKAISAKQPLEACREVSACLDAILAHSGADITESGSPILLREAWVDKGESELLLEQILDLQRDCNMLRFAAGSTDVQTAQRLADRAKPLVAEFMRGAGVKEGVA